MLTSLVARKLKLKIWGKSYWALRGQRKDERKLLKTDKELTVFSQYLALCTVKWWLHNLLNFFWDFEKAVQFLCSQMYTKCEFRREKWSDHH